MSNKIVSIERDRPLIRVEKDIPLPQRLRRADERFPFADMEPGNSFFVPHDIDGKDVELDVLQKRMAARCQSAQQKYPDAKYIARKVKEKRGSREVEGIRVWRVPNEE